jgi:hypothetical protein
MIKEHLTSVEIQSEAVDIVNLASSIGQQSDFLERVRKDERMFEMLLGVDCTNFDILLEEVQIPCGNLTLSGKQRVHEKKKSDLIHIEFSACNDPVLALGIPINDAAINNLPSPRMNSYQIPEKNG